MSAAIAPESSLLWDRLEVNRGLESLLAAPSGSVGDAMRYAVLGAGQRLRPILALRVGRMLGGDAAVIMPAAIAVELLHCASLVIDDLPCMDNQPVRRNRPSVHVEFSDATAVLAAFALVSLAARSVAERACFQMRLLSTLDCDGLVGGQALDLELNGDERNRNRSLVSGLKTVPLFQLAVEAGMLDAPAAAWERQNLSLFGFEFGMAYQMVDDYLDGELIDASGVDVQFQQARGFLNVFGERSAGILELLNGLNAKIWEEDRCHR